MVQFRVYHILYSTGVHRVRDEVVELLLFGFLPIFRRRSEVARAACKPTDSIRARVFSIDNWQCVYCGSHDRLTVDHIIPSSRGGPSDLSNLVTCCKPCNTEKADLSLEAYGKPMIYGRFAPGGNL